MTNFEVKKIYFDMDGVLADFDRGILEICGLVPVPQNATPKDEEREDEMWRRVKNAGHFYDMLEPMPGAKEMFDAVYGKYKERCEILTGIPSPRREIDCAADDKVNWMRRLLSDTIKINTVRRREKQQFCTGSDCVLIDDYDKNIDEWTQMGGTGILFTTAEDALKTMREMGIL